MGRSNHSSTMKMFIGRTSRQTMNRVKTSSAISPIASLLFLTIFNESTPSSCFA